MQFRRLLFAAASLLAYAVSLPTHSKDAEQIKKNAKGDLVLEGMVVYGKRVPSTEIQIVTDSELIDNRGLQPIKQALENVYRPNTGFNIDFAPDSSVLTATGRDKLDLISYAMKLIDKGLSFEIHVGKDPSARPNYRTELALDRTRAIVNHLKVNRQVKNLLFIPGDENSPLANQPRSNSIATSEQNVVFVNVSENLALADSEQLAGTKTAPTRETLGTE